MNCQTACHQQKWQKKPLHDFNHMTERLHVNRTRCLRRERIRCYLAHLRAAHSKSCRNWKRVPRGCGSTALPPSLQWRADKSEGLYRRCVRAPARPKFSRLHLKANAGSWGSLSGSQNSSLSSQRAARLAVAVWTRGGPARGRQCLGPRARCSPTGGGPGSLITLNRSTAALQTKCHLVSVWAGRSALMRWLSTLHICNREKTNASSKRPGDKADADRPMLGNYARTLILKQMSFHPGRPGRKKGVIWLTFATFKANRCTVKTAPAAGAW